MNHTSITKRTRDFPGGPVVKNPLPMHMGSVPDPGRLHMSPGSRVHAPQLQSLLSRACALQQEKPWQWEAPLPAARRSLWAATKTHCEVKWKLLCLVWLFATPRTIHTSRWNSPGKNTGVGSLSLLQGIFPTQGSNPGLRYYRWILYQLSHQGSPRMLEWVAFPFSSVSSRPRDQTGVSCLAGGFFTSWATREAIKAPNMS